MSGSHVISSRQNGRQLQKAQVGSNESTFCGDSSGSRKDRQSLPSNYSKESSLNKEAHNRSEHIDICTHTDQPGRKLLLPSHFEQNMFAIPISIIS